MAQNEVDFRVFNKDIIEDRLTPRRSQLRLMFGPFKMLSYRFFRACATRPGGGLSTTLVADDWKLTTYMIHTNSGYTAALLPRFD